MNIQKKIRTVLPVLFIACAVLLLPVGAFTHTVQPGDTMWKLAVRYQVGLSEIKAANPDIQNAALIYPGDVLNIPWFPPPSAPTKPR